MNKLSPLLFAASVLFICYGCEAIFRTTTPMPRVDYHAPFPTTDKTLVILLPGGYSSAADFETNGFFKAVADKNLPIDLAAADAHYGYYHDRSLLERLTVDFIDPARKAGYRSVWLSGMSMGGLGTLIYARKHPERLDGILLMAAYIAESERLAVVKKAGGFGEWPVPKTIINGDWETEILIFLHNAVRTAEGMPKVYIGWGRDDRFAGDNKILADSLSADHSFVADGGHDWPAWLSLWKQFLDSGAWRSDK